MPAHPIEDSASLLSEDWPTPAATHYGSSQNGINGIGGANERPSARTPGLQMRVRMEDWPTPSVMEAYKVGNRANYGQKALSNHPEIVGLPQREKAEKNDNTAQYWPTATAGDAKSSGSRNTPDSQAKPGTSLTDAIREDGGTGRLGRDNLNTTGNPPVLSPAWVSTLMGFDPNWLRVSDASLSELWETQWSRKSRMKSRRQ